MSENVLEKIINKKIARIDLLKKSISLESLEKKINQNKSFINFKDKIIQFYSFSSEIPIFRK